MGRQVLARGIVFIDLAIADIAGLGVIAADASGWEPQGYAVQVAAVSSALVGAALLTFTERRWPDMQEASMACCSCWPPAPDCCCWPTIPMAGNI